jgi:signal transduction histidine kinase
VELSPEATLFRRRLLIALVLVVSITTLTVIWVSRSKIAADEERQREHEFQSSLALLHSVQQIRHATLVERCRALARKPRIHAALEDGAVDLLYLSADDELRDLLADPAQPSTGKRAELVARFYRFLDANGKLIAAQNTAKAGVLSPAEESRLSLAALPVQPQIGYLTTTQAGGDAAIAEVITVPIIAQETGEGIAALVLGFDPVQLDSRTLGTDFVSGIWFAGELFPATIGIPVPPELGKELKRRVAEVGAHGPRFHLDVAGESWLVLVKQLNPGTLLAPADEICAFPLAKMLQRQKETGWQILGAGAVVMLAGLVFSYILSFRLSVPVERLAHDSHEQRAGRERAEAALETTSAELGRAARFSANASHQLKTPVAVLRAGLEMMQAKHPHATPAEHDEIAALIHQTYRVSSVIEDLLLLSRMDAGQLKLKLGPVNLSELIAATLDDLSAMPEENELAVEEDCPPGLWIMGEKRYTALILQNLLENARKYNRPGGRITITSREKDGEVLLTVGNTAERPIPPEVREHIFERFHRGGVGENIPGYGLGLNLARELARIHQGDLRLLSSDETWTEFAVSFRVSPPPMGGVA